jgi:hypothetical protein
VPDPVVVYPDLELFLIGWYRIALAARPEPVCAGVTVDRIESTATSPPKRQLIIRDDGTTRATFLTGQASIGLTVLAGTKANPKDAKDLARIVLALASQIPSPDPDNPFASFDAATGPYMVPEAASLARVYSTATFSVAGRSL